MPPPTGVNTMVICPDVATKPWIVVFSVCDAGPIASCALLNPGEGAVGRRSKRPQGLIADRNRVGKTGCRRGIGQELRDRHVPMRIGQRRIPDRGLRESRSADARHDHAGGRLSADASESSASTTPLSSVKPVETAARIPRAEVLRTEPSRPKVHRARRVVLPCSWGTARLVSDRRNRSLEALPCHSP